MTDQDPTQPYVPTVPPAQDIVPQTPDAVPASGPATEPAAATATAPAQGAMPTFEPPAPPSSDAAPGPVAPVPAAPVTATRRSGRSPVKWIAAALVALLIIGIAGGATLFLTASAGSPAVAAWTPADSVAYGELRLDLPGSQSAELAKTMKAFPGFQDQAAFPVKLSEALDQLVTGVSDGKTSYKGDIEPWFTGQIGASVGPLPASAADAAKSRGLLLLGSKDAAKAQAWAAKVLADTGATTGTETYNGVQITTVKPSGVAGSLSGMEGAYAVVGPALALGDVASVKASIDTGGKTGLASVANFQAAESSLPGDRLGFGYLDTKALAEGAGSLAQGMGAGVALPSGIQGEIGPWAAAAIQAQDGAFVVQTRSPRSSSAGQPGNTQSKLPGVLPATTVALVEGHDVGKALATLKDTLGQDPSLKDGVKQVDDALQLFGGFGAVAGWIDELGVAVTRDGSKVAGGIVATPSDAASAERLFTQITGLIQLGGASAGLKVTTAEYNGTTIYSIDLGSVAPMLGQAAGGVQLPSDASLSYAVTKDVVVIGYGVDFVKSVLDAPSGESLADSQRFSTALKKAGEQHSALAWIDIAGIRDIAESMVPASDRTQYDANLKPYLAGLDSLIATSAPSDTLEQGTIVISVTGG